MALAPKNFYEDSIPMIINIILRDDRQPFDTNLTIPKHILASPYVTARTSPAGNWLPVIPDFLMTPCQSRDGTNTEELPRRHILASPYVTDQFEERIIQLSDLNQHFLQLISQDKSCGQLTTRSTSLSDAVVRPYAKSFQGKAVDTSDQFIVLTDRSYW
ncbi:hypothetical protein FF38_08556 [Lucilia cuprina]|uniref:Uncharacterized protein n=1 Tax=Lucilia cuprina TaxID=7375 RepID=A0A0L0CCI0_LUCCU|nr:hypothetical protein FF38_08556 [Lucilia cuprina]